CEKAVILHGPVVAAPIFTWSRNDLATAPAPASEASLNLRSAPSESPDARACCPSSIVAIHLGISGGGDTGAADSDAAADGGAAATAARGVGVGTGGGRCRTLA